MSAGAQTIRDLKVAVADGLEPSMYWPGSGGGSAASAGEMRLGTFRMSVATRSAVSLGVDTGGLLFASDVSRVYAIQPSVETLPLFSQSAPEQLHSMATTKHWVVSTGTVALAGQVTFPLTYDTGCVVSLSAYSTAPRYAVMTSLQAAPSATTFLVSGFSLVESGNTVSLMTESGGWVEWMALGSGTL